MTRSALGWGIIGTGRIVETTMAPAMIDDRDCALIAVVSRDRRRADTFAERFKVRCAYTDYGEMLANPDVGAVYVATPNVLHAEQIVAAAQAGKHVLSEKPLALTASDAQRAIEACDTAGVTLGVNFHNRYLPWVEDVRRLIADRTIGDIVTIEAEVSAGRSLPKGWRADPVLAGLGTINNVGVHLLEC